MDLNFRRYIYALLLLLATAATSCVKEPGSGEGERGAVQFNVLDVPSTRLAYDGVHTSFSEGESIGCVIASEVNGEYQFCSVTEWTYNAGTLQLVTANDEYVREHSRKSGYIEFLDPDMKYALLFYYPYDKNKLPTSETWTSYPMLVETNFTSMAVMNASDHLWSKYVDDQSRAREGEFYEESLNFKKLTATVEIHSDHTDLYEISNLHIDAISGTEGIKTSMMFDLGTGNFTPVGKHEGKIWPLQMSQETGGNIHDHGGLRMLFVPQTILSWKLCATVKIAGSSTSTQYEIPLGDKLNVLEAGKQYIFHITKKDDGLILIKDWDEGESDVLFGTEVNVPKDLTMWSNRDDDSSDGSITVKNDETVYIKGKEFYHDGELVIHHIEVGGTRIIGTAFSVSSESVSDPNTNDEDAYNVISFDLPYEAQGGVVNLVMDSGIRVSPGSIQTIDPKVTSISPENYNMNYYNDNNPAYVTIVGNDLDLVASVTFGGGYSSDVMTGGSGSSIRVVIPEYAQTGELVLSLKNQINVPSGKTLTIQNPNDVLVVTSITGRYIAGEKITVTGEHLGSIEKVYFESGKGNSKVSVSVSSNDGSSFAFVFPKEAKDGRMTFCDKNKTDILYSEDIVTVKPSYLEVLYDYIEHGVLTIVGYDLDVVEAIKLSGSDVENSLWSYDPETHRINLRITDGSSAGTITLTTKNGYDVSINYTFTRLNPTVTEIISTSGRVGDSPNYVKAKKGDQITITGEHFNLVSAVKIYELTETLKEHTITPNKSDDNKSMTFDMPEITADGYFYLILSDVRSMSAGGYKLVGEDDEQELWSGDSTGQIIIGENTNNGVWKEYNVKIGDRVRIYCTPDPSADWWQLTVSSGHWSQWMQITKSSHDAYDQQGGYVEIEVNATIYSAMTNYTQNWGHSMILQSQSVRVTRVTLVQSTI